MKSALGEAIEAARRANGLTQAQAADASGITQTALSRYETGERKPESDILERLAGALGVTSDLLLGADRIRGAMAVDAHMRKRKTAKPTIWRQLEAKLNIYRLHTRHLFEEVSMQADQIIPRYDPLETTPEDAARLTRMQWRMPVGPVRDIVAWMESAGCVIFEEDFESARVDGLSQWVNDYPIVLLNTDSPPDRRRLTLAHELGHLCLHSVEVTEDMESEADRFAAEFLMPADVIRPSLRNLTEGRLFDLKREWGVSMQALIERAYGLKVLSGTHRTTLYKKFSARGWRTREPISDELPDERSTLTGRIGDLLAEKGLTLSEIARLAGFDESQIDHPFRPTSGRRLRSI